MTQEKHVAVKQGSDETGEGDERLTEGQLSLLVNHKFTQITEKPFISSSGSNVVISGGSCYGVGGVEDTYELRVIANKDAFNRIAPDHLKVSD